MGLGEDRPGEGRGEGGHGVAGGVRKRRWRNGWAPRNPCDCPAGRRASVALGRNAAAVCEGGGEAVEGGDGLRGFKPLPMFAGLREHQMKWQSYSS